MNLALWAEMPNACAAYSSMNLFSSASSGWPPCLRKSCPTSISYGVRQQRRVYYSLLGTPESDE